MVGMLAKRATMLLVCIGFLGLFVGCAERKTFGSAQDQTFVAGPVPKTEAPKVEEAKMEPAPAPPPAEPPQEVAKVEPAPPLPVEAPVPEPLTLADVYFDYDRFVIRSDAQAVIEANARRLKAENDRKVLIEGHCDERGTVEYNLVLGERRAQKVKQYLLDLGVQPSQIRITSYGKEKPFCTDHSEACWQSNRRAHFVLP